LIGVTQEIDISGTGGTSVTSLTADTTGGIGFQYASAWNVARMRNDGIRVSFPVFLGKHTVGILEGHMMRIFNFRYLLIAAAMLAVWLLARGGTTRPELDASWTPIKVSDVDALASTEVAVPDSIVPHQPAPVHGADLFEEAALVGDLVATGEEGLDESNLVDSNSEPAWGYEQFTTEATEPVSDVVMNEVKTHEPIAMPETDSNTEFFELSTSAEQHEVESLDQTTQRISNRFATEADTVQQTEESSGPWTKNPFVNESVDFSMNAEEMLQAQSTPVSPSVLEMDHATQASFPEPGLPKINDIASMNVTLSESVAQEAVHHIEYGKSLSRRGASFGARQKFFAALGVIARGNDVQTGGNAYTTALGRATRALREVQDFAVRNADINVGISVSEILETHQTRIIGDNEASVMTPVEAMQRYFTFAHQQMSIAGGKNAVTAEALYCLGKLHSVMAKHQPETLDIAKAIVFHRAALSSDAQNSRSYNELGVLLARSGHLVEAESLLKQSLQINPLAETWQNLAKIHNRQGQVELAQLAQNEFVIAAQLEPIQSPESQIAWLPGQAFNQVGPADFQDSRASTSAVVPVSRTIDVEDRANGKKTLAERLDFKKWF